MNSQTVQCETQAWIPIVPVRGEQIEERAIPEQWFRLGSIRRS